MPKLLKPRSLRAQLALAFATLIGLIFIAGAASALASFRVSKMAGQRDADAEVATLALRSQTELFMARRYEKDFLFKPKGLGFEEVQARYTALVRIHHANIRAHMERIRTLTHSAVLQRQTESIETSLDGLQASFFRLVQLFRRRLDPSSGIDAQLQRVSAQIASAAGRSGRPTLAFDALRIADSEKGYFLLPFDEEANQLRGAVSAMAAHAAQDPEPSARNLEALGAAYERLLSESVDLQRETGREWKDYVASSESAEPAFEKLRDDADAAQAWAGQQMEHSQRMSLLIIAAAVLLTSLIGGSVAFSISRGFARRIGQFLGFAGQIASGQEQARMAVSGADELSALAEGLNQMAGQLETRHLDLRQAVEERERAQVALLAANEELEARVQERTQEVVGKNDELKAEISERLRAEEDLKATHKKLLALSRQAGMAEIATSVLHNVGNVLNSVNVSTSVLADSLRRPASGGLAKVNDLLRANAQELPAFFASAKGIQVVAYLETLVDVMQQEGDSRLTEIRSLEKHVEHIKAIVVRQQSFCKSRGLIEELPVRELVEDAFALSVLHQARPGLTIVRDYCDDIRVSTDRHKVSQILLNLLNNAKQALEGCRPDSARITVRTRVSEGALWVAVEDSGCGIAPENLGRLFHHGFTTKDSGHGFGLHSSACAADELGGSLRVESAGPGKGATFTLRLPLERRPVETAPVTARGSDARC
jgi:signal transduction histidine kinase